MRGTSAPKRVAKAASIVLTHPDRKLFNQPPITKQQLADYYRDVAGWLLPELVRRPLSLVRCPGGIGHCFFQRHASPGFHPAIKQFALQEKTARRKYIYVEDVEGVVALVQMGVIELHAWGTHVGQVARADRLVMDLDPGEGVSWPSVVEAALGVREHLQRRGLESFVRTSGGKGLHVLAPLQPAAPWAAVKALSRSVAQELAQQRPRRYIAHAAKQQRRGLIYVDYLRNARGASSVASYSLRAREGAPAAVPLGWDELPQLRSSLQFGYANLRERLAGLSEDPWAGLDELRQTVPQQSGT